MRRRSRQSGITLLDTLVGTFLMLVIFVGIAAAFQLSVELISNNKARAGAVALGNERMEYMRSLSYSQLGTVGGIPAGPIPQSENIALNGVNYVRRTVVEYVDDPKDGTGASDSNGISADYKAGKVDVSWLPHSGTARHLVLASRFSPTNGMETSVTGGTLIVKAVNATGTLLPGATVQIVNSSASPAINTTTFTNASGTVSLIGAPAASNYQITVSQSGYSTAQTYSVTAQNTNPSPANVTVSNNVTTTSTFAIDVLGTRTVRTWLPIAAGNWTDTFANTSKIATSTNIAVSSNTAKLNGSAPFPSYGEMQTIAVGPSLLAQWKTLSWTNAQPGGTSIRYRVYDGAGQALIPEVQLPGNAAGFTASPVDLSNVSTTTYPALRVDAVYSSTGASTPSTSMWKVDFTAGPTPLANLAFSMTGAKTIGSGPSGTLYKYSQSGLQSDSTGTLAIPNLEWDTYGITVNGTTTGYDISSACGPQPESLAPGGTLATDLFFSAHTTNSLLVDVHVAATGALLKNATVMLTRTGFSANAKTDSCGQAFFSGLTSGSAYTVAAGAAGYATSTITNVSVGGASRRSLSL